MSEKLEVSMNEQFNDYVIKLLNKNRIYTISDFLRKDVDSLARFTNIDCADILMIKNNFVGIEPVDGHKVYRNVEDNPYLTTKIKNLDILLKGGLMKGNIIDICGLSAAGKTQLCTTIAINLAQYCDIDTFFIDTKGDFSGKRVQKILEKRGCTESAIEKIMKRMKVERINDPYQLVTALKELIINRTRFPNFQILVIDSLPALWFLFHGDKSKKGKILLTDVANLMRELAVKHEIVILTVNIVTNWIPSLLCEQMTCSGSSSSSTSPVPICKRTQRKITPGLGKYWHSTCSVQLLINCNENDCIQRGTIATASDSNAYSGERFIYIIKSNEYGTGNCCNVKITDTGLC